MRLKETVLLSRTAAEDILSQYPSLELGDIYATLAYFLHHRDEVEAYLLARREEAAQLRTRYKLGGDGAAIRARLLARWSSIS